MAYSRLSSDRKRKPTSIVTDDAEFQIIKSVRRFIEELTPSFIDDKIKKPQPVFILVAVIMKDRPVQKICDNEDG